MGNRKEELVYQIREMEEEFWGLTDIVVKYCNEFILILTALALLKSSLETSNKVEEKQLEQLDFKIIDLQISFENLKSDSRNSQILSDFYTEIESILAYLMRDDDNIIIYHMENFLEIIRLKKNVKRNEDSKYTNYKIEFQKL